MELASAFTAANATTMTRSPTTTMPRDVSLMGPAAPVSLMSASVTVGERAEKTTPIVNATTARCASGISPRKPMKGLAASTASEMSAMPESRAPAPVAAMAPRRPRIRRKLSSPPADSAMSPMATPLTSFRSPSIRSVTRLATLGPTRKPHTR